VGSMKKKSTKSGFTLVEILIVTAVVGILAAIGITNFTRARAEAAAVAVTNSIQQVFRASEVVYETYGALDADLLQEAGIKMEEVIGPYRRMLIESHIDVNTVTPYPVPYADVYIRNADGNLIALITPNMIDRVPVYIVVSSYPETAPLIELWTKCNYKLDVI